MGIKVREGYWDIYAIIFLSTFFTLLVLLAPKLELMRIILGTLFLLLFPGYVTTSVIWPMKYDENEEIEDNPVETLIDEDEKSEQKRKEIRTINGTTRLALSVGLSLGITPIISFIFNELYSINSDIFGLRTVPILLTIYLYIMMISGIATWRRERLPRKERLQFSFEFKPPFENSLQDKIITTVLIILIILSTVLGIYLFKFHHENESFSEFYILGPEKRISNYPRNIFIDEEKMVYLGINNREYESVDYEVRIFLNSRRNLREVDNLNNIFLEPNSGYLFKQSIDHNQEFQSPLYFKINRSGNFDLNFQLIKGGEVYRELVLKLYVFKEGDMIENVEEDFKFFLLSPSGQPGGFPSTMDSNYSLNVLFGMENLGDDEMEFNISISPDDTQRWFFDVDREFPLINKTGYYFFMTIQPRRTVTSDMRIKIPQGNWVLNFNVNGIEENYIRKEIYVH
jgi:uncharacterized membrane protein